MQTPDKNCPLCPRLVAFREASRIALPVYWNAPVPSFGALDAELLIIGLAPGLHGANQTGRPFTGDYAGLILYSSLLKYGFAEGIYNPSFYCHPGEGRDPRLTEARMLGVDASLRWHDTVDNLQLLNCRITNAVRCVPPENKPELSEIKNCNRFLVSEIAAMPKLKAILSLGLVSHNAVLKALGQKASAVKFVHGAACPLPIANRPSPITLYNSYHCSRYNINTKRLTQEMFDKVIETIQKSLC